MLRRIASTSVVFIVSEYAVKEGDEIDSEVSEGEPACDDSSPC